jgi:hypothetical protein
MRPTAVIERDNITGAAWRGCFESTAFLKASGENFDRSDAANI